MSRSDFDLEFDLEDDDEIRPRPALEEVLAALKQDAVHDETLLYGLSDLDDPGSERVSETWGQLDVSQRRIIMQMLVDVSEANYEVDFDAIGFIALSDPDEQVRRTSIEVMAENETVTLMNRLIRMSEKDPSLAVRAEAARALGRFVLMGELGDLGAADFARVQGCVLRLLQHEPHIEVRCCALEALANSSHEAVIPAIAAAYESGDLQMKRSAIIAMGNTADERWETQVLEELTGDDADISREAARAAGELQLAEAVPHLIRLMQTTDRETQEIVVESLGEIGTKEAVRALSVAKERAEQAGDTEMASLIEDALGNAALVAGNWLMTNIRADE